MTGEAVTAFSVNALVAELGVRPGAVTSNLRVCMSSRHPVGAAR